MKKILVSCLVLLASAYGFAQSGASEENPVDKTDLIVNPSFENGLNGWTSENLATQTNTSFTKKAGTTYIEKWVSSGNAVGSASVKQTIENLPFGIYKLTVAAQNLSQSATTKKNSGAYVFASDQQTPVYTPADYSVTFTNITGSLEIGFIAENATGNWLALDNFRLQQVGDVDKSAVIDELGRVIAEAESLQTKMMSATAATALQTAISAAKSLTAESADADIMTAAKNLHNAISAASTSIAEYEALQAKINEVEAKYDATKEGAEAFKAEIDKAKALVVNADATSQQLADEITALDKALLAFCLANATPGTGTAPKVTVTNHYVATGATEALMRATSAGSNILERGVCWSTEHNPTVLDNRTTKMFNLKGYIFHIKGLTPSTVYYLRPYVMNQTYTVAYGDEVKIVTHPKGTCVGTWNEGAPDEAANKRCREAIKQTIDYFNEWTGIRGFTLSGNYGASTPTADCSYGGWMRIGPNAGNQAIGTVLHETGHGVGVGTHWRWYDCADTRANTTYGYWLGREANTVLRFLENCNGKRVVFTGDGTHGWGTLDTNQADLPNASISFDWLVNGSDKDKHQEIQYIGGMCILYGLFIDGLCPTGSDPNGIAGYTYNYDDNKKYYLMCKDEGRGLGTGLLFERKSNFLGWQNNLSGEAVSDSAAWYLEYNPQSSLYRLRNASTGNYITRPTSGTSMKTKKTTTPSLYESFQLMPDRTDVTLGTGTNELTTHGYWFTWNSNGNKAMGAGALVKALGYGSISISEFDFSDNATAQQWIIISEDELQKYKDILIATSIQQIEDSNGTTDGNKAISGIYTVDGSKAPSLRRGINIIRYQDGTSRKIVVR